MKLAFPIFVVCAALFAQDSIQTQIAPLGIPCEPGGPSPFGFNIPFVCPPVDQQGYLVFLRSDDTSIKAYRTTMNYTTAEGEDKTAIQTIARSDTANWTVDIFRVGRMQTPTLTGTKVTSVTVEGLATVETKVVNSPAIAAPSAATLAASTAKSR
jgi:hypothetical protein